MAAALTVPDDLVISLWHSFEEFTLTPVRGILEVPTQIEAVYDGPVGFERDTPERLIRFSFGWAAQFAGHGIEDVGHVAAQIATHLAAMAEDWPGGEAHVVCLPVVDASFVFEASPQPRRQAESVPPPASIMEALALLGAEKGGACA